MFNPLFIRRAANLFQNGAILGKVYQPHESHVPFGLQFLIDYNLYGMSFLHTPAESVRYRKSPNGKITTKKGLFVYSHRYENIHLYSIYFPIPEIVGPDDHRQFAKNAERTSVSRQELDIGAAYILNRLEIDLPSTQTDHANPGIASIWKDEQVRRSRQPNAKFPKLEVPPPEERPLTRPTESDCFFREALFTKLRQINESQLADQSASLDQTLLSRSVFNETKNKFNLKQLLSNSVYPSECSQLSSGNILDASLIINHQSGRLINSRKKQSSSQNVGSFCFNQSLVDEDIVNSLSQKQSQRRENDSWADVSRK